jgi:hypothetical protein
MMRDGGTGGRGDGDLETGRLGDWERPNDPTTPGCSSGFTLFEVVLAIVILVVAIVPMVNAFKPSLLSTQNEEMAVVFTNQARGTLNRVASMDFTTLWSNQGTPGLDTLLGAGQEAVESFSLGSVTYTPIVSIADASSGTGGLLEITVTVNQIALKTLKADY